MTSQSIHWPPSVHPDGGFYFDACRVNCFGRSQFGLLHLGQTRGFSLESRGNHSCPQRQRQPNNWTIPISGCFFIGSPFQEFTKSIYDLY
jgi:hypothetical protein